MSGIYIPGMEMPTSCRNCFVRLRAWGAFPACDVAENYEVGRDLVLDGYTYKKVPDGCPLIPVPDHGRLIDADALMKEFEKAENTMAKHGQEYSCSFLSSSQEISTEWYCVEDMLDNAPTIIPADKEEK